MKLSKVALQLYTLRDFCGSAKDLATSLKKVKAIGYDGVEFVRSDFASNRDLRKLADDNGLAISSIHEDGDRLLNHPQRVAEELTDLGTDLAVYAYPTGIDFQKGAEVDRLIQQLQHSSEAFAAAGKRLVYHNHALEFAKHDEKLILEYILGNAPKPGRGPPFSGRCLLMGADKGRVEHQVFVSSVRGQQLENAFPHPGPGPSREAFMDGFVFAIPLRQIAPSRARPQHP